MLLHLCTVARIHLLEVPQVLLVLVRHFCHQRVVESCELVSLVIPHNDELDFFHIIDLIVGQGTLVYHVLQRGFVCTLVVPVLM